MLNERRGLARITGKGGGHWVRHGQDRPGRCQPAKPRNRFRIPRTSSLAHIGGITMWYDSSVSGKPTSGWVGDPTSSMIDEYATGNASDASVLLLFEKLTLRLVVFPEAASAFMVHHATSSTTPITLRQLGFTNMMSPLMAADVSWLRWTPKIRWCLSMWC